VNSCVLEKFSTRGAQTFFNARCRKTLLQHLSIIYQSESSREGSKEKHLAFAARGQFALRVFAHINMLNCPLHRAANRCLPQAQKAFVSLHGALVGGDTVL